MYEAAIIGGGPAGIAAAIQLRRYYINPLLLEYGEIGGLLLNANLVENYPGFAEGIPGVELVDLFRIHLLQADIEAVREKVTSVDYVKDKFRIETNSGVYESKTLVIASGTKAKPFDLPYDSAEILRKVYSEIYPLIEENGKTFIIVGGGDAAFDYALNLARRNKVFILNRSGTVKCNAVLWERASESADIEYLTLIQLSDIHCKANRLVIVCREKSHNAVRSLEADYIITAVGREPNLDFIGSGFKDKIEALSAKGLLHFAGDVRNALYRQTAICVGDGVMAAMRINNILRTKLHQ